MQGIYMIKNIINGKVYVGKSDNLKGRLDGHYKTLKRGKNRNAHLQNSWNKYGKENFYFSIIEDTINKNVNEREKFWINFYNSMDSRYGYNKAPGGDGGCHSPDIIYKISQKLSHKKLKDSQAQEVYDKLIAGITVKELAVEYNVSEHIIKGIKFGSGYKYIDRSAGNFTPNKITKLTDEDVMNLLKDLNDKVQLKDILKKYKIGRKLLNKIRNNEVFTHINRDNFNITKKQFNNYKELNDELCIKILLMLQNGERINDISKKLNVKYNDVKNIKENKVFTHIDRGNYIIPIIAKQRSRKLKDDDIFDILIRIENGESNSEIARVHGDGNIIGKIRRGVLYKDIIRKFKERKIL